MVDHYLDTAHRDLLRGGYACRPREGEVGRHWLLTVKGLGGAEGAVHQREEHEGQVPPKSAPADWPESPARDTIARLSEGRPLTELFILRQLRNSRAVERGGRAVGELSLDTVEANIAGRTSLAREALHHMRVATRRQRAALRIASPYFRRKAVGAFRDELRTLAGHLGEVRDLDVLIEAAEAYGASRKGAAAAALDPLLDEWRSRRDGARDELLSHLDGEAYRDFTERFGEFLSSKGAGVKDTPDDSPRPRLVCHVLPTEIWDHYGRLRAYEPVMEWAPIETIHSLRIEDKRLRYLLEFFAEALGPGLSGVIEALVGLQDHIGELHDVDVTIGLLRDFLMRSAYASTNPRWPTRWAGTSSSSRPGCAPCSAR